MDPGFQRLLQSFAGVFLMMLIGQILRRVLFKTPEDRRQTALVAKLFMWCTVPATIFMGVYSVKKMPIEGLYLAAACAIYQVASTALSAVAFGFVSDPGLRASCAVSTSGYATGLFLGVMNLISGAQGVAMLVFFDLPNCVYLFVLQPMLLRTFAKPTFLARLRTRAPVPDCPSPTTLAAAEVEVSRECPPMEDMLGGLSFSQRERRLALAPVSLETIVVVVPGPEGSENPASAGPTVKDDTESDPKSDKSESDEERAAPGKAPVASATMHAFVQFMRGPTMSRLLFNLPIWAVVLGLTLGLSHAKVPDYVLSVVAIPANANAFVAYVLVGLLLDTNRNTLRALWKQALASLAIRYVSGIAVGIVLYATIGRLWFGEVARTVVLFAFSLPLSSVVQVTAGENGCNQALPSLVATLSVMISFPTIMVMLAIVGVPRTA